MLLGPDLQENFSPNLCSLALLVDTESHVGGMVEHLERLCLLTSESSWSMHMPTCLHLCLYLLPRA